MFLHLGNLGQICLVLPSQALKRPLLRTMQFEIVLEWKMWINFTFKKKYVVNLRAKYKENIMHK